ncbi:MAG: hypothetical protein Q7W02_19880 [Candidatus Rokubacteria bacterium]|nr:hypothetical protein [Candidatus Rokubacteria bacterium]
MRNVDEDLERLQQEQAARQEDLKTGRVRVIPPVRESAEEKEKQPAKA